MIIFNSYLLNDASKPTRSAGKLRRCQVERWIRVLVESTWLPKVEQYAALGNFSPLQDAFELH